MSIGRHSDGMKEDHEKERCETPSPCGSLDSLEPSQGNLLCNQGSTVTSEPQSSSPGPNLILPNPRLHLFVLEGQNLRVYFYSVPKKVPPAPPIETGKWPILKLGGTNYGATAGASLDSVTKTKTFRDSLSEILSDGSPRVSAQDLKRYKLFITSESDENGLKVWTGDALGSISVCSDLLEGTDTKERAQLPQYLTAKRNLTGISWTQYKFPPKAVGYLKNEEGRFVCFVVYGVDD